MTHVEFLERQWVSYQKVCKEKNMNSGTKEEFIKRNTPKDYTPDCLLNVTYKAECLHVKAPLFKAEENVTLSRRELRHMLEDAAQLGYELGKESA